MSLPSATWVSAHLAARASRRLRRGRSASNAAKSRLSSSRSKPGGRAWRFWSRMAHRR